MAERVFIAMGSNIDPEANLRLAVAHLASRLGLLRVSRVYQTVAVKGSGPKFLNAAVLAETGLDPAVVKFEILRPIEAQLGRQRGEDKNAPRTIDLDLALYGRKIIDDPQAGIRLPDPDILRWGFVAIPLADLDPVFVHPVSGETLAAIAERLASAGGVAPYPLALTSGG